MNEDTTNRLLNYLAVLGFDGREFTEGIRNGISSAKLVFSMPYRKQYDDRQMLFELKFRYDRQFDAYRLEGYKATHRKPITIEHQLINGINTADLEERMKRTDWVSHFELSEKADQTAYTKKILSDLWALNAHDNLEGVKIQELLQFKYFPVQYYDERLKELQSQFDQSRNFSVTERGICNANLAYHILSGNLKALYEKLRPMALDHLSGEDTYSTLERILSRNPDRFELKCLYNTTEEDSEIVVPVSKADGRYLADHYTITVTPYPTIEHGTFNGIDTQELERLMQALDWKNDSELFTLDVDDEPELMPEAEEIVARINRLSEDADGIRIADQLKLKYWPDASFFDGLIEERAWKYLKSLPKREQQFPVKTSTKAAFNLLCGRAVLDTPLYGTLPEIIDWKQLDLSQKDKENNYPIRNAGEFSKSELENLLHLLPIDGMDFYSIRNGLQQGDLLPVQLRDDRKVMLLANPEQKTIDIFTHDMRPIPANLRLDPDWKPSIAPVEKIQETRREMPPAPKQDIFSKQSPKRRGRGKRM